MKNVVSSLSKSTSSEPAAPTQGNRVPAGLARAGTAGSGEAGENEGLQPAGTPVAGKCWHCTLDRRRCLCWGSPATMRAFVDALRAFIGKRGLPSEKQRWRLPERLPRWFA